MKRILLIISIITTLCLIHFGCSHRTYSGIVVDRQYVPSSTGIGTGVAGNQVAVVTTTTPQKWEVVIRCDDGSIVAKEVDAETWSMAEKGKRVTYTFATFLGLE